MINLIGTYTLTSLGTNLTRPTGKCSNQFSRGAGDVPELTSTQDIDKYADFIVTAISTVEDKAIPTSKSGHPESNLFGKSHLR